jgi:hypothetical protein
VLAVLTGFKHARTPLPGWQAIAALNGQAVSDLIADGWLSSPTRTDHAHIVAWPLTQEGSSYA